MNIGLEDLLQLIGEREVIITLLRKQVLDLQRKLVDSEKPVPGKEGENL